MGCIYLAWCKISQKGYVGFTFDFEWRKAGHRRDAENGSPLIFHRAIRKYGWDAFEWTILYEDDDTDRDWLGWWEQKYIRRLKTKTPNGYNMTDGGDGGDTFSGRKHRPESIEKMRESSKGCEAWNKGKTWTEEIRRKLSEAAKNKPPVSEETRKKISEAGKGRQAWNKGLPAWNKGLTLDEACKDKSEEIRKKMSQHRKGKTMEEIYGAERAAEINKKQIASRTGRKVVFSAQAIENIREGVRKRDARKKASLLEGS